MHNERVELRLDTTFEIKALNKHGVNYIASQLLILVYVIKDIGRRVIQNIFKNL